MEGGAQQHENEGEAKAEARDDNVAKAAHATARAGAAWAKWKQVSSMLSGLALRVPDIALFSAGPGEACTTHNCTRHCQ